MLTLCAAAAALAWLALLLLPWRPWSICERIRATAADDPQSADLSAITILIPARDEAEYISETVTAARAQGRGHRIIVIDDQSRDDTAARAAAAGAEVISGTEPPQGWSGKLWALQQGLEQCRSELLLQLDADISLQAGILAAMQRRLRAENLDMISIMALLPTANRWQRLLLPAYVWFFKLIYPFALVNRRDTSIAAAAGGCILLRSRLLAENEGYRPIAAAIIDDCALADRLKRAGARIWIGLSRDVISRRDSRNLVAIGRLISRTAYAQLQHSPLLLLLTTLLMLLVFWAPVPALLASSAIGRLFAITAFGCMWYSYRPLLRYYRLPGGYAAALPPIAAFYLLMTWVSAWRHWSGQGTEWKQRHYAHR